MIKRILLAVFVALLVASAASAQAIRPNKAAGGGTFTGGTLTSQLLLDATNTLCSQTLSLAYAGDTNLGLQRSAADILLVCTAGTERLRISTTAITTSLQLLGDVTGGGGAPTYSFVGDPDTGVYRSGANSVCLVQGGALTSCLSSTGLTVPGTVSTNGYFGLVTIASVAGINFTAASGANAAGEIGSATGTNATLATTTLDATLHSFAYDIDGTPIHVLSVNGAGHILVPAAIAAVDAGTGTCTSVTVTGTDLAGHITATCALNQTVIITWGRAYGVAPRCQITAADAAAAPALPFMTPAAANLTMTVTVAAGVTAADWDYICVGAAT